MKINALIKKAKQVKSNEDASALGDILEKAITSAAALKNADVQNPDSFFDATDSRVYASFEINNLLSADFAICAKVVIDGEDDQYELTVRVSKVRFNDHLGNGSKDYEIDEESEDEFTAYLDESTASVAKKIKNLMIRQHASLIQSVGVSSYKLAYSTAKKCF